MLLSSRFRLREALSLLAFTHDINRFYTGVTDDVSTDELAVPEKSQSSWLAVFRHEESVWRLDLEESEYRLLGLFHDGEPVESAINVLLERGDLTEEVLADKLERWFGRWMSHGMLSEVMLAA